MVNGELRIENGNCRPLGAPAKTPVGREKNKRKKQCDIAYTASQNMFRPGRRCANIGAPATFFHKLFVSHITLYLELQRHRHAALSAGGGVAVFFNAFIVLTNLRSNPCAAGTTAGRAFIFAPFNFKSLGFMLPFFLWFCRRLISYGGLLLVVHLQLNYLKKSPWRMPFNLLCGKSISRPNLIAQRHASRARF